MKRFLITLLCFIPLLSYGLTLKIGVTGNNPPFCSRVDLKNHYYGFDIELMQEICRRLHATCHYVPMTFHHFFSAITTNQINLAIDSIIILPSSEEKYLLSRPYLPSSMQVITNRKSNIHSLDDLATKRIGVRLEQQSVPFFNTLFKRKMNITTYHHMSGLLEALIHNKVDAIVINSISAEYWYANDDAQFRFVGSPMLLGEGFGIMAKPGEDALIAKVNQAILSMEKDGSYSKIYQAYFGL